MVREGTDLAMARRRRGERMPLNAEINVVSLIDVMMLLHGDLHDHRADDAGRRGRRAAEGGGAAARAEERAGRDGGQARARSSSTKRAMSFEEFRAIFKALAGKRGEQGVYLRADEGAHYGHGRARARGDARGRRRRHRARGGADGGEVVYRAPSTTRLGGPLGVSVVLHASLIAAAIFVRPDNTTGVAARLQGESGCCAGRAARDR